MIAGKVHVREHVVRALEKVGRLVLFGPSERFYDRLSLYERFGMRLLDEDGLGQCEQCRTLLSRDARAEVPQEVDLAALPDTTAGRTKSREAAREAMEFNMVDVAVKGRQY